MLPNTLMYKVIETCLKFDFKWPINTVSFDGIDFGLLLKLNNILIGYKTAIKKEDLILLIYITLKRFIYFLFYRILI